MRLGRPETARLRMNEELERLATIMLHFADDELQGSPLYERLARAAAEDPALLEPLLSAPKSQRRATLYFAAIHDLVLRGEGGDLARHFPDVSPKPPHDDPVPALRRFLDERRDELRHLYEMRNTQTNEVGRCAFLLPMFGLVAARARRPLAIIEAGASAGLNLLFDRYRYDYGNAGSIGQSSVVLRPEIKGDVAPPVPDEMPKVTSRIGLDIKPVDVRDDGAIAWLRACIWPEHAARVELFMHAVEIARADPPEITQGEILESLPKLIASVPPDMPVCVFHTATLAYMSRDERAGFAELIAEAGRAREVWWVSGEGPRIQAALHPEAGITGPDDGYALVVARAGDLATWVGEAAYHGRWVRWRR